MISVIVTTKDQANQVEASIRALIAQDFQKDFEIIAVDDGSTDSTVEKIMGLFGERVRVIEKGVADGWLNSLNTACQEASGEVIAVCDPHCIMKPDWIRAIASCFESHPNLSIITGPAFHGHSFMQKLSALTSHAQFLSLEGGYSKYIFDDNFAIRKDILVNLLSDLPVEKNVSDSVGCALLSSQARKRGVPVFYEPRIAAFHISPGFTEYLGEWAGITAETTIAIRLLDPSTRGAGILKYLYLAPFIYPTVRILLDVGNAWRLKKVLRLSYLELPFLLMADMVGKIWYCAGLINAVKTRRLNWTHSE